MDPLDVRLKTNLRRGVLEYSVLALADTRPMYGKLLAAELMERDLIASEGSLYPLLARLREEGLIEQIDGDGSVRRRFYVVTPRGLEYIRTFEHVWDSMFVQVDQLRSERHNRG